jgi:hypothetical protein
MNIIYVTTAMKTKDFNDLVDSASNKPNPAGQNFHSKLIKALSMQDDVRVISLVPVATSLHFPDTENWKYIYRRESKISRYLLSVNDVIEASDNLFVGQSALVLFDSLNLTASRAAAQIAKKRSFKSVAILTDNPNNFANPSSNFASNVISEAKQASAALALSEGLLQVFAMDKKPNVIFPGLVEEPLSVKPPFAFSYMYFGGALYEKYGVIDLLNAYVAAEPNMDLVVAGHGPEDWRFTHAASSDPRIHFLGQVTKERNYALEAGASLLLNPRPYDEKLDKESVPSKMFEYLVTNKPILSVRETALQKEFPDDVNWLDKGGEEELKKFFLHNLSHLKGNHAKEKVLNSYGLQAISQKLHAFIATLN